MAAFIKTLQGLKIVPVIKVNDAKNAFALGEALVRGGLPVAEITFRTEAAEASIKEMRKIPGLLVGQGPSPLWSKQKWPWPLGRSFS